MRGGRMGKLIERREKLKITSREVKFNTGISATLLMDLETEDPMLMRHKPYQDYLRDLISYYESLEKRGRQGEPPDDQQELN